MRRAGQLAALLAAAAILGATQFGPAAAQEASPAAARPITSIDDCLKQLQSLVEDAHAVDLLDDQIEHAEAQVASMEKHCLASEFGEAGAAAGEVRKIIASNK